MGHVVCNKRGEGRLFWRCGSCRLFFDALVWSFLPRLKIPLPWVLEVMKVHFTMAQKTSAQDLGRPLVVVHLFFFKCLFFAFNHDELEILPAFATHVRHARNERFSWWYPQDVDTFLAQNRSQVCLGLATAAVSRR